MVMIFKNVLNIKGHISATVAEILRADLHNSAKANFPFNVAEIDLAKNCL